MSQSALFDVLAWNRSHPTGTKVVLTLDDGAEVETVTRSEAWLAGARPLVAVAGRSGGYALSRVRAAGGGE